MNSLALKVSNIVKDYSHFPAPIVNAQIKRIGKDVDTLTSGDLPNLAEAIGKAVTNFSNPVKGEEVKLKILTLK